MKCLNLELIFEKFKETHTGPSRAPLHYAAQAGNVRKVKLFLEHGADINAKDHKEQVEFINLSFFERKHLKYFEKNLE